MVRSEFKEGQFAGWVVDGTWLLGEVIAQTGQYCLPSMVCHTRLACAHWLASSCNNKTLAAQVMFGITERGGLCLDNVLSFTSDACATNACAWRTTLSNVLVYCDLNLCFVHGGSGAASKMDTGYQLDTFKTNLFGILNKPGMAASIWVRLFGEAPASRNNIRYCCCCCCCC